MNISNFDLNLLRAFDVLMRERSVTRAAEELNLTQPAMSNVLRRLRVTTEWQVLGQYFFYLETSSPIDSSKLLCTS